MRATSFKPPVIKVDLEKQGCITWSGQPLAGHISDFERLLMIDVDAPTSFDSLPLSPNQVRSKTIVDGLKRSFQNNPALKAMVQRLGPPLMADRSKRLDLAPDSEQVIKESVDSIKRRVVVKQAYRPRY